LFSFFRFLCLSFTQACRLKSLPDGKMQSSGQATHGTRKTRRLLKGATSPCPQLRRNQVRKTMHTNNQEIHSFSHRKNHQRQAPKQSAPVRWGRTLSRAIATGELQLHTLYPLCPNVPEFAPTRNASTPTILPRVEHARQGQAEKSLTAKPMAQ